MPSSEGPLIRPIAASARLPTGCIIISRHCCYRRALVIPRSCEMIDTLKISRRLENADFSEKQAEELADILREAVEGDLVTRDYLDARMTEMEARIERAVSLLVRWMIGLTVAGVGLAIALARASMTVS